MFSLGTINAPVYPQKFLLNYDYGNKQTNQSSYLRTGQIGKISARPKTQEKKTRNTMIKRPIEMYAKRFSATKIESDTAGMPTIFDEDIGVNAWRPTL